MSIKISVIIPVYNVENYLDECLESIQNQSLRDIEIICINDGSKDSSKSILEKYKENDNRIFIIDKPNGGYGAACNMGLKVARGEYISIIEPDDFIDTKMYEEMYSLAVKHKADIVKSSFYEYRDDEDNEKNRVSKITWSKEYKMPEGVFKIENCTQLVYFHPSIWSCIYKKDFLKKNNISFVEAKGAGWVDNPFQIQTLCLAERIFYTDNAYYYYRLTNPSSSSNIINVSNPFDRSDEVHNFLQERKIKDENLLAHLYKREIVYIQDVLGGISSDLFEFVCEKISKMTQRMRKDIVLKNKYISDYEKDIYNHCNSDSGIESLMKKLKKQNSNVNVIQMT